MTLITRVSRLFRADLNAVLDRIEEPDVLLKQAIRDMEEALSQDKQRFKGLSLEHGQLIARQADLAHSQSDIELELDVCFESGNDELARALIRRKLEAKQLEKFLVRKREALEANLSRIKARLAENQARLNGIRQKAEMLSEDERAAQSQHRWTAPDVTIREEDVEVALLREKRKRSQS